MSWTMKQAEERLAKFSYGGLPTVRQEIVQAMATLADTHNWEHLRQVIRFTTSRGGKFYLPQQYESLVRAVINNTPVPVRGIEYSFLYGGPGDIEQAPSGFAPMFGISDEGMKPPFADLRDLGWFVAATMPDADGSKSLTLVHHDGSRKELPITATPSWDVELNPVGVQRVLVPCDELPDGQWIQIWRGYEEDVPEESSAGAISTSERVPEFRYYQVPGAAHDAAFQIMAEVHPRFLHTYGDDDVIPFQSLLPLEHMMQALTLFNQREHDAAVKFQQSALAYMEARDSATSRKQTTLSFNNPYDMSPGEDSLHLYENI